MVSILFINVIFNYKVLRQRFQVSEIRHLITNVVKISGMFSWEKWRIQCELLIKLIWVAHNLCFISIRFPSSMNENKLFIQMIWLVVGLTNEFWEDSVISVKIIGTIKSVSWTQFDQYLKPFNCCRAIFLFISDLK